MFKDLKRRGEFEGRFNSFSEFVQCKIEELHDNPERVEKEFHEEKAKFHREKAEKLEEEIDVKEKAEEVTIEDQEWIKDKLNFLQRKANGAGVKAAFNEREQHLVQAYSREFDSINPRSLRKRMESVAEKEGHDVDLTA